MKFSPSAPPTDALLVGRGRGGAAARRARGFTLAEVLAALLLMAIIIPVALQGMGVLSRAAILGQRKVTAMRVAERVLNEQLSVTGLGQVIPTSGSGTETEGTEDYPWTMQTETWPEDTMTQMTVTVTFKMQGTEYQMKVSTLFDPGALTPGTPGEAPPVNS